MLGTFEAFTLAGPGRRAVFEIASKSSDTFWSVSNDCPVPGVEPQTPADHGYEGDFAVAMMLKDLTLAQEAAARVGATTPLGERAEALYALFVGLGFGRKGVSAANPLMRGRLAELVAPTAS